MSSKTLPNLNSRDTPFQCQQSNELEARTQATEAQLLVSNELRAEIEVLQQQAVANNIWSILRNVQDLIDQQCAQVPRSTTVPHMRSAAA